MALTLDDRPRALSIESTHQLQAVCWIHQCRSEDGQEPVLLVRDVATQPGQGIDINLAHPIDIYLSLSNSLDGD